MTEVSVAYKLFHHPYPVEIQNKYLYLTGKDGHMGRLPGFSTGNKEQDEFFLNDWTVVYRVPAGIVMLYAEGIDVRFTSVKDMAEVYELLKEHVNAWAAEIKKPFPAKAPKEDLLLMDEFAEVISFEALEYLRNQEYLNPDNEPEDTLVSIFEQYKGAFNNFKPKALTRTFETETYHSTELIDALESTKAWRYAWKS